MKLLTLLTLAFLLSLAYAFPRKHRNSEYERRRVVVRHRLRKEHKHQTKHEIPTTKKTKHHGSRKHAHKVYKKFGMFNTPSLNFEDMSTAQSQGRPAVREVLVPMDSARFTQNTARFTQNAATAAPEMMPTYTDAPPSQRATLGTEVAGDLTNTDETTTQNTQPQTVQFEGGQIGTNEDNSALKTTTQGATLQEAGATPTEMVGNSAGSFGAGSEGIQSFTQQDFGKPTEEMKDLQVYNGPLPDSGKNKPKIEGVSPNEEVKIVNLGDDMRTVNVQQEQTCGGCPAEAKCVNGQCQIREELAQAEGLTGKGSASNPGTISDIRNLETQELSTLFKDATKADAAQESENPTVSPISHFTTEGQERVQEQSQQQHIQRIPQEQKIQFGHQTAQFTKTAPMQQIVETVQKPATVEQHPATVAQKPATVAQPHFSAVQLKELRDFARMYKMYQFIRKMEERLNDPDCAPVCRKTCKDFCPAKCCRGQKVNNNVVTHLMQTAGKLQKDGKKEGAVAKQKEEDATVMEDNANAGKSKDMAKEEEKKVDKAAPGKKHILIRIVKNDVLDKPRRDIKKTV